MIIPIVTDRNMAGTRVEHGHETQHVCTHNPRHPTCASMLKQVTANPAAISDILLFDNSPEVCKRTYMALWRVEKQMERER